MIDESVVIRNLLKGNIHAFNDLYNEYSSRLYHFALGYLKNEAEAKELVQEVFTRIWEKRMELKEGLSLRSFLFTIAFNIIRKHFRTRAYLSGYLREGISIGQDMQTSQQISYDSLRDYVLKLVDQLPERRREIFIKSRFEGYKIEEIAREMKISHKTVENQLTDALKFLRSNLNRENLSVILFYMLFIS